MKISPEELEQARAVLGISGISSIREIRTAYRRLWRETHPDTKKQLTDIDGSRFVEIKKSYDLLIRYCEDYDISFTEKKKADIEHDHIMQYYDGWLGNIKKNS